MKGRFESVTSQDSCNEAVCVEQMPSLTVLRTQLGSEPYSSSEGIHWLYRGRAILLNASLRKSPNGQGKRL